MKITLRLPVVAIAASFVLGSAVSVVGRGGFGGGGRGGGGGVARSSGGGSFSRPSVDTGSLSRPSGGQEFSRPSGGEVSRPAQLPSYGGSNVNGGRVPSDSAGRPSAGERPALGGGSASLPASDRPANGINRPGAQPVQRPGQGNAGNFLGVAGGAAVGGALAGRAAESPAHHPNIPERPANGPVQRPEQRANWADRSQNRNEQWKQRVDSRHDTWNNWQQKNQDRLTQFQQTRDQRWNSLQNAQANRQNWRNQNRQDWQQHRQELWSYRADRADEIRGRARDYYDNYFDDRWWGRCAWGYGYRYVGFGYYPANPWWWWTPANWTDVSGFVGDVPLEPAYIDYGMNVNYEGDTVYVDGQPVPASQYTDPVVDLAVNAGQPPPPTPPAEGQQAEWLPLGVYALAQEEKGDPILFLQISVNRAGEISGAYSSTLTADQRPITGMVDKASQRVVWRIGMNTDTIFETSLANLTLDVSPVAVHFGTTRTQTWLLTRMPEPPPAGKTEPIPDINPAPPPLKASPAAPK